MATGLLPPVAPPSYEEALQTPAPDLELGGSDEPPPSYSEATVDDEDNEVSPESATDQNRLIVVRVWRRINCGSRRQQQASVQALQVNARYRRNRYVCLVLSMMTFMGVVGCVLLLTMRSKASSSSHTYKPDFHIPTVDPEMFKWIANTPEPLRPKIDDLDLSNIGTYPETIPLQETADKPVQEHFPDLSQRPDELSYGNSELDSNLLDELQQAFKDANNDWKQKPIILNRKTEKPSFNNY